VHAYVVNNSVQQQLLLQLIIIYDDFLEPMAFFNPEIPELEEAQSPDFGIENAAGIPGSRYCNPYATDQLADASVSRVSALVSAWKASRTSL